jgi:hypothetical protein
MPVRIITDGERREFATAFDAVVWLMMHTLTPAEVQKIRLDTGRLILNSFPTTLEITTNGKTGDIG